MSDSKKPVGWTAHETIGLGNYGNRPPREEQPTSDQCTALETLPSHEGEHAFAVWHPQWGGYVGRCKVTFSHETSDGTGAEPGCFDVKNWHDGEFACHDHITEYHYCAATQLVDFGLTILERQLQLQVGGGDEHPVALNEQWVDYAIKRLQALKRVPDERRGDA